MLNISACCILHECQTIVNSVGSINLFFIAGSRSTHDITRGRDYASNRLYLDLERDGRPSGAFEDPSPPSDNEIFDNQCYATTPSSSNGNSDLDQPSHSVGGDVVQIIQVDG